MLVAEKSAMVKLGKDGSVIQPGLALSYILLSRTSEIWGYSKGVVHSEFCLTRVDLSFFQGPRHYNGHTEGRQTG